MKVDSHTRELEPLYRQVVKVLKQEIMTGVYPLDTQLPTETELQERFGVSRHTVREALRQLKEAGLVTSRQGSGTTVIRPGGPQTYIHEVASISDLMLGKATELRMLSTGMITADAELVGLIGGKARQRWLRVEGRRFGQDDSSPLCYSQVFVDGEFAGVERHLGRRPGPIYVLVEELYGELISAVEQTISAITVPAATAELINVSPGETGIEVRRTYRLATGKVAIVAVNIYPAARFYHTMTLRRSAPEEAQS